MEYSQILTLIKSFEESTLMSMELEFDNVKLKLSKQKEALVSIPPVSPLVTFPTPQEGQTKDEWIPPVDTSASLLSIKSPLVGTFYGASSPTSEPFVKVGQHVTKGQTIGIVEAMKIMNEIASPYEGTIEKIELKSGNVVGFDQVMMWVRP